MTRRALITQHPFSVRAQSNGVDITASLGLESVTYRPDGTGTRQLVNGARVSGHWRFLDDAERRIEVEGPEGTSQWIIVELTPEVYRKVNLATGVELIHVPLPVPAGVGA